MESLGGPKKRESLAVRKVWAFCGFAIIPRGSELHGLLGGGGKWVTEVQVSLTAHNLSWPKKSRFPTRGKQHRYEAWNLLGLHVRGVKVCHKLQQRPFHPSFGCIQLSWWRRRLRKRELQHSCSRSSPSTPDFLSVSSREIWPGQFLSRMPLKTRQPRGWIYPWMHSGSLYNAKVKLKGDGVFSSVIHERNWKI